MRQVKRRGTRTITLKHGQKTVVDQETYNWAKHWNWYLLTHHRGDDYAATSLFNPDGRFQVYLHQLIRKPVEGFQGRAIAPHQKLNPYQKIELQKELAQGIKQRTLARKYGITPEAIFWHKKHGAKIWA